MHTSDNAYFKMDVSSSSPQVNVVLGEPSNNESGEVIDGHKSAKEPVENETNNVDTSELRWGPWLSHYAWKSGNKVINAVDYAGESLATFFGITTPKFQIEIDEYERIMEEERRLKEESVGWVPKNAGGDIPLVLSEPVKVVNQA